MAHKGNREIIYRTKVSGIDLEERIATKPKLVSEAKFEATTPPDVKIRSQTPQ